MISDMIHTILKEHRDKITIELLEQNLKVLNIKQPVSKIIRSNKGNISMIGNIVFLKTGLMESQEQFNSDFEEYIRDKISDREAATDISNAFKSFIPEILFVEWMDIPLEKELMIFDLLFSMIVKNRHKKDHISCYFSNLIELYEETAVYSSIIEKNADNQFNSTIRSINQLDQSEETLKRLLYDILTKPDKEILSIENRIETLEQSLNDIRNAMENIFQTGLNYSPILMKRVINSEIKRFNPLYLLKRFDFNTFYEWVIFIAEESDQYPINRLIEDLDIN